MYNVVREAKAHRWNRKPRPQPEKFSKTVSLTRFSRYDICLNWLSGALVGVGGSDFIFYSPEGARALRARTGRTHGRTDY